MIEIDARKRVVTYVILTFVLSAPFYYLVRQNGGLEGGDGLFVFPLMWMPALAIMGIIVAVIFWRIGVPGETAESAAQP